MDKNTFFYIYQYMTIRDKVNITLKYLDNFNLNDEIISSILSKVWKNEDKINEKNIYLYIYLDYLIY